MSNLSSFSLPPVYDNPAGWGPASTQAPESFKEIPYALFSKSDKVSRAANWVNPGDQRDQRDGRNRGRRDFVQQTYGSNSASAFAYQAEEDEKSFSLVDHRGMMAKKAPGRGGFGGFGGRGGRGGFGGGARGGGMQRLGRGGGRGGAFGGRGGGRGGAFGGRGGFRRRYGGWRDADKNVNRMASVKPTEEWELVQEIEFNRMEGLSFLAEEAKDIGWYGKVGVYDHLFDRVSTKMERPLRASGAVRYNVTASEDPVLANVSEADDAVKVFATDSVLATLMAATVSASAWDVVVNRVGDKLYLDKRDGGPLDFPSVNENADEPPADATDKERPINSAPMLASEARDINRNFIRQLTSKDSIDYGNENPFNQSAGDGDALDDAAYRYRLLDFSAKKARAAAGEDSDEDSAPADQGPRCLVAVRTEISGVIRGASANKLMFIRALTQHDVTATGAGGALDWRKKLDTQRGAVIGTEMSNNSSKLARWAFQAILAGAHQLRIGFVSRVSSRDRTRHTILGSQPYNPSDFVAQLGLDEFKAWGIVKVLIDYCLNLDEGRYVIMRDPNKPLILIYAVPPTTFDDGEDEAEQAAGNA
ncbi:hypothetical protein H4R19_000702 [Coemansia spiralis]|nr:hypothetical protein H4R19_000702 [Coemansia spiralis]